MTLLKLWLYTQLKTSTVNHSLSPFTALELRLPGTQIHDPKVRVESSGLMLDALIEPRDLVYYLGLEPALHGLMA